uniref:Uncharacterized protein n=1 Tax=Panagrolaimus davidi TaxID=227884 RepID=A0A914Q491_9BILA
MTPYASAMGICLFLIISKVGTAEQKQRLPIKDIFVDHSDVFMTQMFLGLNIHPTILAILYQNINREKVINETLNLLFNELCSGAKDFTADQYKNMLNKLQKWVGDENDVTSKQLRKLMDSNENKYETRKTVSYQ